MGQAGATRGRDKASSTQRTADIAPDALHRSDRKTNHAELGSTAWYAVRRGDHEAPRGAWEHVALPGFADVLADAVAFAWHAMDAVYEEDERILGHAADPYHRIDIRQTFCPYKGLCSYYDIGDATRAAWSYRDAYTEVGRIGDLISFEPDKVTITIDREQLHAVPGHLGGLTWRYGQDVDPAD